MSLEPTAEAPARGESSRRKLLAFGAAVVGGLAAQAVTPHAAEAHGTIHADSAGADPAVHGANAAGGPGVQGDSAFGPGVLGSGGSGPGIHGISSGFHGVFGRSIGGPAASGVFGFHSGDGTGVAGESATGIGVSGHSSGANVPGPTVAGVQGSSNVDGVVGNGGRYGVHAFSQDGEGVHAVTINGIAVRGIGVNGTGLEGSANTIGVKGLSGPGVGINGESFASDGVVGLSHHMDHYGVFGTNNTPDPDPAAPPFPQGAGVFGQGVNIGVKAFSNDGHAIDATSTNGTALDAGSLTGIGLGIHSGGTAIRVTGGKLKFNSVGSGTIPAGAETHTVVHGHVTSNSHVTVVLTSDPGNAVLLQWVARAAGSFTINLTRATRRDTTFTYFIVDPSFP